MPEVTEVVTQLGEPCLGLLRQYPEGLSEYQLLQQLRDLEPLLFPELPAADQLGLFQQHFLLFHILYTLQQQLYAEQSALLQISPLSIVLSDYTAGEEALSEADPLRDYYLDLSHLDDTSEEEVFTMLAGFWRRMQLGEPERVAAALEVLELASAEDFSQVKQQYKRLVMRHHPDRGGEEVKMHALNEAYEVLRVYFHG